MKNIAIIAFGSNLQQPEQQIKQAIAAVAALPCVALLRVSSLYRTAPVGYLDQPDFINAVGMVQTSLAAPELLAQLHAIEQQFGRERSFRNAPRTLDLDLIDFNHKKWNSEQLTLPHPRAHERGFVMLPLAEIAPDFVLHDTQTAQELAAQLHDNSMVRLLKSA
ncbi:2-amino-4-hydroxy-6-hydroxymethyldihydropteridine diphosphokinase [Kingella kingae]|uniref:2-amino-4-hydroxy-6- hydroxymethyldihydropteridine diphosphokinase n=1 Tax=Kingella kingae TaxID=504 RepID=UPI0003FC0DBF|nr:2-amino-4-hydroxy-6-hydroxymethyldihydropteridine diphosphokinase [Kingella kingae]MDK4574678.1 2-amino-4-hydroxy-6-hydroxymethyldihydropteridine diphosphokinase [Kingella kingae]MDK4606799.1 2-amino-4-hydroxy-6-hydroxymethyldihydropteridine diphosphokinase [Kingella kingae]